MTQKCFKEVADFEDKVKSHELNVIFLHDDTTTPKRPIGSKYNYQSYQEVSKETNSYRNLGIGFPKKVTKDVFLCVIDIDGDSQYSTDVAEKEDMKFATRKFLFEVIKLKMEEYGLKPMYVKTANNGFHIYLYITQSTHKQHGFQKFQYPNKDHFSNGIFGSNFLNDFPILNKIANKRMGTKSIEIFTQGAYVVAPGSEINGRKYELLPDGAQTFDDISVYGEKNIQDFIEDIFLESFFPLNVEQPSTSPQGGLNFVQQEDHNLLSRNIKAIGDLIIKAWPLIDGQKQEATLALGGFLHRMNVSEQSIRDIGNYVIDHKNNPNFFKHDDETERTSGFMTSLLHDTKENDLDKKTNGLTFLKNIFQGKIPSNELSKILWLNSRPSSHSFYPNGQIAKTYDKVKLDFENKRISYYEMGQGKWNDDKGDFDDPIVKKNKMIFHSLDDFQYVDDISSPYESDVINKKVSFIATNELGQSKKYIFENTSEMFKHYGDIPGAHIPGSEIILRHIINEYERIGLIEETEGSSVPGIYLSRDGKNMRRFIQTEVGVDETDNILPDKEELASALKLLTRINEVYPWEGDKFGVFVKLGIILPYGYIFKSHFNDFFRGIILYGEAGTLKSTAASLLEAISLPQKSIQLHKKWYITSGSDLRTEFRIGRALDRHSYPIIVNECEGTFSNIDNRELLKNAISDLVIREPGGDNPKTYYSRGIPILTANELVSAVETSPIHRRFLVLNFIEKERGDIPEIKEKMKFLNEDGRKNSRFKELKVIGDFVFYTLSHHLEYFYDTPQDIAERVIRDMENYTDVDLSWISSPRFEVYEEDDRMEESQNELDMFLGTIRKPFNERKVRSYNKLIDDETLLESMIENDYEYIVRVQNKVNDGILITPLFQQALKKRYYDYTKSISLKRLEELINDHLNLKKEVFYTKNPLRCVDGSRKRGIFIEWTDFCSMMNIQNGVDASKLIDTSSLKGDKHD